MSHEIKLPHRGDMAAPLSIAGELAQRHLSQDDAAVTREVAG